MRTKGWITMALLALALSVGTGCSTGDALSSPRYSGPEWAPPYYSDARYYYMPDMEVYYDAYSGNFIFWDGFAWSNASALPSAYRYHDLYNTHIIFLDSRVTDPWAYHNHYTARYPKGYYQGPRSNPQMNHPSGNYPSRVYDENEGRVEVPTNPRGIDNNIKNAPERSIQQRQRSYDKPDFNERPQIRTAPQQRQVIPSQPAPAQPRSAPQPQPNKAPVKAGQGKGG